MKRISKVAIVSAIALVLGASACSKKKEADEASNACRSMPLGSAAQTKCQADVCIKYGKDAEYSCGAFMGQCRSGKDNLAECKAGCTAIVAAHGPALKGLNSGVASLPDMCAESKFKD